MLRTTIKSIALGIVFSVLASLTALASESIVVSGNTITYTVDVTGCGKGKSVNLYVLMNGASVDVRGSQASNYTPRSNHIVKKQFIDMSAALGNNTKNKANPSWYTLNASGARSLGSFCSSISYSYTLNNGRFIATVVIVDPISEVSGICFVKLSSSGKDTYYDKIAGGEKDISLEVLKARGEYIEPTQPAPPETQPEVGPGAVEETEPTISAEEEARLKAEEEARRVAEEEERLRAEEESKKAEEKAKKVNEISDIRGRIKNSGNESSRVRDTEIPCKKLKQFTETLANLF